MWSKHSPEWDSMYERHTGTWPAVRDHCRTPGKCWAGVVLAHLGKFQDYEDAYEIDTLSGRPMARGQTSQEHGRFHKLALSRLRSDGSQDH